MSMSRWIAGAALAALLGGASPSITSAKPPDLPVDEGIRCREQPRQGEFTLGPIEIEIDLGGSRAESPPALDALCPCLVPTVVERLTERVRAAVNAALPRRAVPEAEQAERLFEAGERYRQDGDAEAARACYQKAHLLSPTSHFGQRAIQRLMETETSLDAAEEQEEPTEPKPATGDGPQAERDYRQLRRSTQPLGTVQVRTY